jgi:prepilin-type N-terminal cleavage/methylation domain-containing protein
MKTRKSKLPPESLRIAIRGLSRTPHPAPSTPHFTPPRGLTLIEVLISMFVLLIGLLGVGMICQLGRLTLTETAKYDRAAACGRAGLRELRIRRMLDVTNWRDYKGNQISGAGYNALATAGTATNAGITSFDPMDSYCIDPILFGQVNATAPNSLATIDRFPAMAAYNPPVCSMKRVTLGVTPVGPTLTTGNQSTVWPTITSAAASRIFTWRDDLAFDTTYVPKLRPQRIYRNTNGIAQPGFESSVVAPYLLGPRTTPLYGETDLSAQGGGGMGGYSWVVTVTPAYQEMALLSAANATPPLSWSDRHLYNVSVVVFYKRDLTLPVQQSNTLSVNQSESSERMVAVQFRNPTGYGGGDVTLTATSANAPVPGDFFNVKRDDWLLLCGQTCVYHSADLKTSKTTVSTPGAPVYANYFRWYRVVAIDDSNASINNPNDPTAQYKRNVTLAGPDWPMMNGAAGTALMNPSVLGKGTSAVGVLVNNVVGVYSDVVTLESNRLWAPVP